MNLISFVRFGAFVLASAQFCLLTSSHRSSPLIHILYSPFDMAKMNINYNTQQQHSSVLREIAHLNGVGGPTNWLHLSRK